MPVEHYIYDGQNILAEADEFENIETTYTYNPNEYGKLISQNRTGNTSYYHYDALGSTRKLTNNLETITDSYIYSAWGVTIEQTGSTINPFLWIGNFGYYWDGETADYYVRARYYQPRVGRWLSTDPLRFIYGTNHYFYARNKSTIEIDPSGLLPKKSKEIDKDLSCAQFGGEPPCDCQGDSCLFQLSIDFWPNQLPIEGVNRLCFRQLPGEWNPDTLPIDNYQCRSEIDRATKGDFVKITLTNGLVCNFNDSTFPPNNPNPTHPNKECNDAFKITEENPLHGNTRTGGCYNLGSLTNRVVAIEIDFKIKIRCGCEFGGMTEELLELKAKYP